MANEIEKYSFAKTETYWEEVLNTITENAIFDGYFDKIEFYDEENRTNKSGLVFYIGDKVALEIFTNDALITGIANFNINYYLSNGTQHNFNYNGNIGHHIYKFTKTENGVIVNIKTNDRDCEAIIITKTDKDNIGFAFTKYPDNIGATNGSFYCVSFENSESFLETYALPNLVEEENVTILSPLACRNCLNPELLKGCWLMKYSEYRAVPCTFTMNDKQYISNGYLALEV